VTVTYETLSPPGKRASRSLSCTMRPAASTPALSRALVEGELLPEVVFDVVRTGSNEPIYSIRLTRAVISSISERIENGEPFQTVWFDYQTIQAGPRADDVPLLMVKPKAKARPKVKLLDVD
jgi:type VI secretion system Hcp family effector